MRASTLLAILLLSAGCLGSSDSPPANASTPIPATEVETTSRENLAGASFMLGPVGNTPVTDADVNIGVQVPNSTISLTLNVTITQGASSGFAARGLPGCEIAARQVAASDRIDLDCKNPQRGEYDLVFEHTSGEVWFDVDVWATFREDTIA